MTDDQEMQLIRESGRGAKANALLSSELYREVIGKLEAGVVDAWKQSPVRDVEGQTYLRLMMKVLADFQTHIRDIAQTGKMAEVQLEQERTLAERAKAAVSAFRKKA